MIAVKPRFEWARDVGQNSRAKIYGVDLRRRASSASRISTAATPPFAHGDCRSLDAVLSGKRHEICWLDIFVQSFVDQLGIPARLGYVALVAWPWLEGVWKERV